MDHKIHRTYKFKYINSKLPYPKIRGDTSDLHTQVSVAPKIRGGHYLEVPADFFSRVTYQNTDYLHPHQEGIYYFNDLFRYNFINRYFVPNYIKYAKRTITDDEKMQIVKILMNDSRFVNLGITYQRIKSILENLDNDPLLVKNFHHFMTTITIPPRPLTMIGKENVDKIIALNVENYPIQFEQLRITLQLLIIHIINYVTKHKKIPDWLDQSPIKEFIALNDLYVNIYEIKGLPNILEFTYTPGIYNPQNLPFIRTFGKSLLILDVMFKMNTILTESDVVLHLEK